MGNNSGYVLASDLVQWHEDDSIGAAGVVKPLKIPAGTIHAMDPFSGRTACGRTEQDGLTRFDDMAWPASAFGGDCDECWRLTAN